MMTKGLDQSVDARDKARAQLSQAGVLSEKSLSMSMIRSAILGITAPVEPCNLCEA